MYSTSHSQCRHGYGVSYVCLSTPYLFLLWLFLQWLTCWTGAREVGVISVLCFAKLASRAFQKYNNKSSGSTGNQYFTCETVGRTSTWKEECCNQSIFSYIIGNMKNEYRKMVIYNGSSVYLRYSMWLLCPHCSLHHLVEYCSKATFVPHLY